MDPTIQKMLEHNALKASQRQDVWQGELEKAQRTAANAHDAFMQSLSYSGANAMSRADDPETGMDFNFAHGIPGSNLGPLPGGVAVAK